MVTTHQETPNDTTRFRAFEYRLYPSAPQVSRLRALREETRRWYNLCLERRRDAWENEHKSLSAYDQMRELKEYRAGRPQAAAVHVHAFQVATCDLDKAFRAFFRRVKAGEKPGYPRFKGAHRWNSIGFKEYGKGFKRDGRRLRVTGVGRIAVRWHRPLEGRIKTCRIIEKADGWYVAFQCATPPPDRLPPTGKAVGIDLGLLNLVTTSDGEKIAPPTCYRTSEKLLRIAQRRVARRKKGSNRRRKAVNALARIHLHVARQRKDFADKVARRLAQENDVIAAEDLNVQTMVKNHHLAKSISDAGWSYLRKRIEVKAADAGRSFVLVDPTYTSQTCSACGNRFEHLTLKDRWVTCSCGLSLDRDQNAAINILTIARDGQSRRALSAPIGTFAREAAPLERQRSVTQID